ncbi:hypothetical protein CB1_001616005 [Camelus ferus]|nr:hypothetical protein CB1_001616005 [Camelus ferus]
MARFWAADLSEHHGLCSERLEPRSADRLRVASSTDETETPRSCAGRPPGDGEDRGDGAALSTQTHFTSSLPRKMYFKKIILRMRHQKWHQGSPAADTSEENQKTEQLHSVFVLFKGCDQRQHSVLGVNVPAEPGHLFLLLSAVGTVGCNVDGAPGGTLTRVCEIPVEKQAFEHHGAISILVPGAVSWFGLIVNNLHVRCAPQDIQAPARVVTMLVAASPHL